MFSQKIRLLNLIKVIERESSRNFFFTICPEVDIVKVQSFTILFYFGRYVMSRSEYPTPEKITRSTVDEEFERIKEVNNKQQRKCVVFWIARLDCDEYMMVK